MPPLFSFRREPDPAPAPKPKPTVADLYPQFAPFAGAVARRDGRTLRRLFDDLPADIDPTWAVEAASEVDGSEQFFETLVAKDRESILPRLLLGNRHIKLGWQARSLKRAKHVTGQQFQSFHTHLERAERLLSSVTDDDPGNVAAWSVRIAAARGLELTHAESRRRYAMAAQAFPNPVYAQRQLLQSLCPKWGGDIVNVHAFARTCADEAPAGAVNAALIAEGHLEEGFDLSGDDRIELLRQERVVDDLRYAADRSVLHADFRQASGWVWANSVFAYAFRFGRQYTRAKPFFQANGDLVTYPWVNYFKDPLEAWRTSRQFCDQHG